METTHSLNVEDAFTRHMDNVEMSSSGKVVKILEDDKEGTPHQRFIIQTSEGQTLLILNNLERAPRLSLKVGSEAKIKGIYRWNRHGGLIHETHTDKRIPNRIGYITLETGN